MTLIKSISGFRGTIGGTNGENLTPIDIVDFAASYAKLLKETVAKPRVVVGRDARISGKMVCDLVNSTLVAMGVDVLNLGLSTTPTVEMAVTHLQADGGIIATASHNPIEWNALKFLNEKGEFISKEQGERLLAYADSRDFGFVEVTQLGAIEEVHDAVAYHIQQILDLSEIKLDAIRDRKFRVLVDAINSTGALVFPALLKTLHCEFIMVNDDLSGHFAHTPEPIKDNLQSILPLIKEHNCDLGIVVDPDVDRLALIDENGDLFGEEYTIVAIADYLHCISPGFNTVSNLSSSRALADITQKYGGQHFSSAVGEVNVVKKMAEENAFFGGEGNGGVIFPKLHAGRDAVLGVALILSALSQSGKTLSEWRKELPNYEMYKTKLSLGDINADEVLAHLKDHFSNEKTNTIDGLKIDFDHGWLHIRKSNTEPILRLYSEAPTVEDAKALVQLALDQVK